MRGIYLSAAKTPKPICVRYTYANGAIYEGEYKEVPPSAGGIPLAASGMGDFSQAYSNLLELAAF